MLDNFGWEMSLPVKFSLAFAIIFVLILGFFWALRRFGAGSLGSSTRGRQPRLAVIDHASVDGRRRLILVRRRCRCGTQYRARGRFATRRAGNASGGRHRIAAACYSASGEWIGRIVAVAAGARKRPAPVTKT
jgi:hypothetical protein